MLSSAILSEQIRIRADFAGLALFGIRQESTGTATFFIDTLLAVLTIAISGATRFAVSVHFVGRIPNFTFVSSRTVFAIFAEASAVGIVAVLILGSIGDLAHTRLFSIFVLFALLQTNTIPIAGTFLYTIPRKFPIYITDRALGFLVCARVALAEIAHCFVTPSVALSGEWALASSVSLVVLYALLVSLAVLCTCALGHPSVAFPCELTAVTLDFTSFALLARGTFTQVTLLFIAFTVQLYARYRALAGL